MAEITAYSDIHILSSQHQWLIEHDLLTRAWMADSESTFHVFHSHPMIPTDVIDDVTIRQEAEIEDVETIDIHPYYANVEVFDDVSLTFTAFMDRLYEIPEAGGKVANNIYQQLFKFFDPMENNILTTNLAFVTARSTMNIEGDVPPDVITKTIDYKVMLDGRDVTDLIKQCNVKYGLGQFAGEVNITWADWSIYEDIAIAIPPLRRERIEVLSRVDGGDWVSLGRFFLESRNISADYQKTSPTSWGRNRPGLLTLPFASTMSRTWAYETTALRIANEVCNDNDVELDWRVHDYNIKRAKIVVTDQAPIDVINTLVAVVGGVLTTDPAGRLIVQYRYI